MSGIFGRAAALGPRPDHAHPPPENAKPTLPRPPAVLHSPDASPRGARPAFTQTAIAILVTLALALLLQAKLLGAPQPQLISTGGRRRLVIFELYLNTVLSMDGVGLGYILFHHLASDSRPFSPADRRVIELLLLLLLTGLALIALVNRIVDIAWKAPEHPYLEPELDADLISSLWVVLLLALLVACTTILLLLRDQLLAAWLVILSCGSLVAIFGPLLARAIAARIDRSAMARFDRSVRLGGYEASLADATLPGGLGQITIKIFRSQAPEHPDCLSYQEAARLARHINGAWEHVRRRDRYAEVPSTRLRLTRTRDSRSTVVAQPAEPQTRRLRSFWNPQPPSGTPRGLVAWVPGEGVPPLPDNRPTPPPA